MFHAPAYHRFMQDQCKEIEKHVWIESERVGRDIRTEACRDWIQNYSKQFREAWEASNGPIVDELPA